MDVAARPATTDDIPEMVRMYRALAEEQTALKPVWPLTEALAEPVPDTLNALMGNDDVSTYIGTIDDVPFGFLIGVVEPMLPQAGGALRAAIRFIFTETEAREVGVGEAMMDAFLDTVASRGIGHLDAHVSPGHRLAKNFFESNGFKARHIVMYRGPDED